MQDQKFCQSCGMPMQEEQYGTNKNGSKNEEYCCYCYKDGDFTQQCTMEEMAETCATIEVDEGYSKNKEEAKARYMENLPKLNRWK